MRKKNIAALLQILEESVKSFGQVEEKVGDEQCSSCKHREIT